MSNPTVPDFVPRPDQPNVINGDLEVTGDGLVDGNFTVKGRFNAGAIQFNQANVTGNATIGGSLAVGNSTHSTTPTITLNGQKLNPVNGVSVKLFGATGNGTTDDTAAIQAALDYQRLTPMNDTSGVGAVLIPSGIYVISATLEMGTNAVIIGENVHTTILQLKSGSNTTVLDGFDYKNSHTSLFYTSVWRTGSGTAGPFGGDAGCYNVQLSGFTIDGNRANNTAGNGLVVYGSGFDIQDIQVLNCANYGIVTQWFSSTGSPPSFPNGQIEAFYMNITVSQCGQNCFHNDGPHDSIMEKVICIAPSLTTVKTGDAFHFGTHWTGKLNCCHGWTDQGADSMRYALYDAGITLYTNCDFEGAAVDNCFFDTTATPQMYGCNIYFLNTVAGFGYNIVLQNNNSVINANLGASAHVATCTAIQLGTSSHAAAGNIIQCMISGVQSAIDFAHDGGLNQIEINGSSISIAQGAAPNATTSIYQNMFGVNDAANFTTFNIGGNLSAYTTQANQLVASINGISGTAMPLSLAFARNFTLASNTITIPGTWCTSAAVFEIFASFTGAVPISTSTSLVIQPTNTTNLAGNVSGGTNGTAAFSAVSAVSVLYVRPTSAGTAITITIADSGWSSGFGCIKVTQLNY